MTKSLEQSTQELADWMEMVEERIPGIKPMLDQKRTELSEMITDMFQSWIDLADERITPEEFARIMEERAAAELAEREAKWGEANEDGAWEVQCEEPDCLRVEPLVFDELPPLYPTCEDVDGVSCVEDEDDDNE